MDIPHVSITAVGNFLVAMLFDFVAELERVFAMLFFFAFLLPFRVAIFPFLAEELDVSAAVAMFHDVNILDLMEMNRDIEVLKEHFVPSLMVLLNHTERGASKHQLVISVGKIVAFHKGNDVINQSQVHATEQ